MSTPAEQICPDCEAAMSEIRLIDKAHGNAHRDVEYALADSKRGFWLGRFPIEGRITGFMCGECGRIVLYGKPASRS